MAQLLVRDIPEETVAALKKRARANGRSAEAEHRAILQDVLKQTASDFWKEADRLRQELADGGRTFADSTDLIRQDRDSR
jgi:plasmid stability protein